GSLYVSEPVVRQVQSRVSATVVRLGRGALKNLPVSVYRMEPPELRGRSLLARLRRWLPGRPAQQARPRP
ncbi:MAG TPA: adenylate/guanylate cyclase domain-containing protein, partial [Myxococcaceae bacterium]|nr:adenylate/guanylate cyclase domain-containing protein [Myxococcaceae bacterium]